MGAGLVTLLLLHIAVYGPRLRADAVRMARGDDAGLVVCGQSHVPFIGRDQGIAVVNAGSMLTRIADLVRARGRSFLDAWERVVDKAKSGAASRTYSRNDRAGNEGLPLLFTAGDDPPDDHDARSFQVPTSMRDVEPSVHVWLRFKQLDERS